MNVWLDEVDEPDLSFLYERRDEAVAVLWRGCDTLRQEYIHIQKLHKLMFPQN